LTFACSAVVCGGVATATSAAGSKIRTMHPSGCSPSNVGSSGGPMLMAPDSGQYPNGDHAYYQYGTGQVYNSYTGHTGFPNVLNCPVANDPDFDLTQANVTMTVSGWCNSYGLSFSLCAVFHGGGGGACISPSASCDLDTFDFTFNPAIQGATNKDSYYLQFDYPYVDPYGSYFVVFGYRITSPTGYD
jgi:hypothetical protein